MAKIEVFSNHFVGALAKFFNAFPVNRNSFDRKTIRNSIEITDCGEVVGIFPQGTRYPDGHIGDGKKGIGMISIMGDCPVVPMALSGTNRIIKKPQKRIFFPKVRIIYGDAIDIKKIKENHNSKDAIGIIVEKTMSSLRELYCKIENNTKS
jgi:1-acyl-sn-glycerol-3-phosphate acyltransferase